MIKKRKKRKHSNARDFVFPYTPDQIQIFRLNNEKNLVNVQFLIIYHIKGIF